MRPQNIESALQEARRFPPPPAFAARARLRADEVAAMHKRAARDHVGFWGALWRASTCTGTGLSPSRSMLPGAQLPWFKDGTLNVSANCLDVHLPARGDKTPSSSEGEAGDDARLTYRDLLAEVCRLAEWPLRSSASSAAIAS